MRYFIDTENTCGHWLPYLKASADSDTFYLFVTQHSKNVNLTVSYDILGKLSNQSVVVRCIDGTKNALDFQLVAELGRQVEKYPQDSFCIISNDEGYDPAVRYLSQSGCSVTRSTWQAAKAAQPAEAPKAETSKSEPKGPEPAQDVGPELSKAEKDVLNQLLQAGVARKSALAVARVVPSARGMQTNIRKAYVHKALCGELGHQSTVDFYAKHKSTLNKLLQSA